MTIALTTDGAMPMSLLRGVLLLGRWFAKQEADQGDQPEEEGRSESDAAASSREDAPRPTPSKGDDAGDAPESGTRDANG